MTTLEKRLTEELEALRQEYYKVITTLGIVSKVTGVYEGAAKPDVIRFRNVHPEVTEWQEIEL